MAIVEAKIVVITGATSGLGRAAALEFARRGCHVVLGGRRDDALEELASRCRDLGVTAVPCNADITVEEDVQQLLRTALSVDDRIDVWVNNAGVTLFARLDEGPFEEHRRVIETNVIGSMICARAVLPVLRKQEYGVLVNVGSVLSKVGQPFVPSYVISKFALRGLTESLRTDLAELPNVHVCTLLPYAIDTQHFEAGANYVGKPAHPMQPVQSPEAVARALVNLAMKPERERHVPRWIALGYIVKVLLPRFTERLTTRVLLRWHFDPRLQPATSGNLYEPTDERGTVHGHRRPLATNAQLVVGAAQEALILAVQMFAEASKRWWRLGSRVSVVLSARALTRLLPEPRRLTDKASRAG
jgi:short-subunit dehydrogenase